MTCIFTLSLHYLDLSDPIDIACMLYNCRPIDL